MNAWTSFCLAAILTASCAGKVERLHPPLPDLRLEQDRRFTEKILALGKNGDWLVTRGYKVADDLVALAPKIPLSHAAVLDRDRAQVIEAEGKGVHATPLSEFVHKSHRLILIRPVWSDEQSSQHGIEIARRLIGQKYDFLGTVGINSATRFYCSELAVFIYRKYHRKSDRIPRVIEPGQMYLWGEILYDSRSRN